MCSDGRETKQWEDSRTRIVWGQKKVNKGYWVSISGSKEGDVHLRGFGSGTERETSE